MSESVVQMSGVPSRHVAVVALENATLEIYRLGMVHAAFVLRGEDLRGVSDKAMDACADLIEYEARNRHSIATWPVEDQANANT